MSPKVAIVILVVLVVAFVVAVAPGLGKSDDRNMSSPPASLQSFVESFTQPQPLPPGDIKSTDASCLVAGKVRVAASRTCAYTIAKASTLKRQLSVGGVGAYFFVPNVKGAEQHPSTKALGGKIDIPQPGGTLTIVCGFSTCQQV